VKIIPFHAIEFAFTDNQVAWVFYGRQYLGEAVGEE
jgi:hypothetical protein